MHVLAIIFGLLLLLFGGGCSFFVLVFLTGGVKDLWSGVTAILTIWLPLGLLPLVLGWLLVRYGVRRVREMRAERDILSKLAGDDGAQ